MAFNSDEYAWKDLQVVIGGKVVAGLRGVKYKTAKDKNFVYASGDKPHTITQGNKEFSGSVKLLQSEVEALNASAGAGKDLTDITVEIVCSYAKSLTSRIRTHILTNVEFEEFEMGMEQNDPNMEVEIAFKCLNINYNGVPQS